MEKKDKLILLYEYTDKMYDKANKTKKESLNKLDNCLNDKYNLVKNIVKNNNADINNYKSWIKTLNQNEKEMLLYSQLFSDISEKLDNIDKINKFEHDIQEETINVMKEQFNLLATLNIREEKQKYDFQELKQQPLKSVELKEKLQNFINFYESISGIKIEKDKFEPNVFNVKAFEGYNLLNDLKSCDFSVRISNGEFHIIKSNPPFNPKPYEDEINNSNYETKNLGLMIGSIIINEFPPYVIT